MLTLRRDVRARLAILSYHSWELDVATLREDVRELRRGGWRFVSAGDALAIIRRERMPAPRCALLTTDDGHADDEEWAVALREIECPAVTFVCSALIPPERLEFYRHAARSDEFAVEDHGSHHSQHVSSSRVVGYAAEPTPARARDGVILAPGEPLLGTASEVDSRRFDPDPEAIRMLVLAGASASPSEIHGARWRAAVEHELVQRRLAVHRFGRLYLRGHFETREEYEARVTEYLRRGHALYEDVFGRPPRLYAYTWWAGNDTTDDILRGLGYAGSLRGKGAVQRADGRTFGVPRIPIGSSTPRPFSLDSVPVRTRLPHPGLAPLRAVAKRMLGIG